MKPIAAILLFCAISLPAQSPRSINFTQEIHGIDGTAIPMPISKPTDKPQNMTLGDVAVNALESMTQDDQKLTGEDKFKMDLLARKIYKAKAATLTPEEIKLIKDRIGKFYSVAVVGPAWRMLDPEQK